MVDISRSGLAFRCLQPATVLNMTGKYCKVYLFKRDTMPLPIPCRIIYETGSHEREISLPGLKRVGLEFMGQLSDSELDSIVSA